MRSRGQEKFRAERSRTGRDRRIFPIVFGVGDEAAKSSHRAVFEIAPDCVGHPATNFLRPRNARKFQLGRALRHEEFVRYQTYRLGACLVVIIPFVVERPESG